MVDIAAQWVNAIAENKFVKNGTNIQQTDYDRHWSDGRGQHADQVRAGCCHHQVKRQGS